MSGELPMTGQEVRDVLRRRLDYEIDMGERYGEPNVVAIESLRILVSLNDRLMLVEQDLGRYEAMDGG